METNNPRVIFLLGIVYGWFATLDTKKVWSKHRGARSHRVRRRTVVRYPAAPLSVALVKSRELRPSRGPHQALSVLWMSSEECQLMIFGVYELEELGKFSYVLVFKWLLNPREQWSRCTSGSRALYVFFLEVVPSPQTFQREEFPNKVNISVRSHINLTLLSLARLYIQPTKARINQMAMGMWPTVIYDQWP